MRRFVVREVVINVHYENGQIGLEIAKGFAGTDDESLRDAIVFRDPFASKAGASLATTAMLLASEFTKRGEWRKRGLVDGRGRAARGLLGYARRKRRDVGRHGEARRGHRLTRECFGKPLARLPKALSRDPRPRKSPDHDSPLSLLRKPHDCHPLA